MQPSPLIRRSAALCLAALIGGCASQAPQTLYRWKGYETQVYRYLRSEGASREEQIAALERGMIESAARDAALPPGYLAHLGLLYLDTGRTDDALQAWEQEKTAFPESAQYIDHLIGNMHKGGS